MATFTPVQAAIRDEIKNLEALRKSIDARLVKLRGSVDQGKQAGRVAASGTKAAKASTPAAAKGKPGRRKVEVKAASQKKSNDRLPSTGLEFWNKRLGKRMKSRADILTAAGAALPFKPTDAERKKLYHRMMASLKVLANDPGVKVTGSGRSVRYGLN